MSSKCCDFLLATSFLKNFLGFKHWGLLSSRVGYIRLTWEACFDVRAKTRVVQICQVQRQVHLADVFDGGLFVIKLGRTKMLQTWNSSCNSRRARKMTSNLVPKVNIFWSCLLGRQSKSASFSLGWRWVYQILVLSGDDVAVVEKMGSTWSFLLSLKKQVSPGGLPIDEKGATNCSWRILHSVLLWLPGQIKGCWPLTYFEDLWNTKSWQHFKRNRSQEVWKKCWKLRCTKECLDFT